MHLEIFVIPRILPRGDDPSLFTAEEAGAATSVHLLRISTHERVLKRSNVVSHRSRGLEDTKYEWPLCDLSLGSSYCTKSQESRPRCPRLCPSLKVKHHAHGAHVAIAPPLGFALL